MHFVTDWIHSLVLPRLPSNWTHLGFIEWGKGAPTAEVYNWESLFCIIRRQMQIILLLLSSYANDRAKRYDVRCAGWLWRIPTLECPAPSQYRNEIWPIEGARFHDNQVQISAIYSAPQSPENILAIDSRRDQDTFGDAKIKGIVHVRSHVYVY